jgi:glycosidase
MTVSDIRAGPCRGLRRDLHISAGARERFGIAQSLVSLRGSVLIADLSAAGSLAHRMNVEREVQRFPQLAVTAGEIYAAGLLHEAMHLMFAAYTHQSAGGADLALRDVRSEVGDAEVGAAQLLFARRFPAPEVATGSMSPEAYVAGDGPNGPNAIVILEEMLLLRLENENPSLERMQVLFDDRELAAGSRYLALIEAMEGSLEGRPGFGEGETLLDLLRAPMRASPTSISGQLAYVRERWTDLLGERFTTLIDRMVTSLDVLREEGRPRFAGPGPSRVPDADALRGSGRAEYERFSSDLGWMPKVVLLAKSTYVWLDQLSRRYSREIDTLDAIPDEELDAMAESGFTGLWLIGLWERSEASRRIKHLRGQPDAVASAYALDDYRIADDLGGEAAYRDLRDRASSRGIRLASDMVPNHVGIDGRWVIEHPERFLQVHEPPYPGYTFDGPDLSGDDRVGVFLEDHYYDNRDAAVVFKRLDRWTGEARYIYHGNDGTSMPWNDTAQIDYLAPEAREAVIQTILEVARRFPIIRFDAAMTLAKQHVQRLWYPSPGSGGAIPSRSQYGALSDEEFERRMGGEFWREVVDRVAAEVPETLLLAEAFWMMEGYFVRTLGMHRVYNSAFMHMMKQERNAEYRTLIKNVIAFDPQILKRYVNFMNNPDEESAVDQFGRDSKYFGVAVVMSTLPGLPMFGHGQVEGLSEKYGMEFRRAKLDERVDEGLVERHRREVFPLLHRREQFAEVDHFLLYDLTTSEGLVEEDVFAYSNRSAGSASLVLFHNRSATVRGWIRRSAPYLDKGSGETRMRELFDGLALEGGPDRFTVLEDLISGGTTLLRSDRLRLEGLYVDLAPFAYRVLVDIHERVDVDGSLARLEAELAGRAVADLDGALADLALRPLHDAFLAHLGELTSAEPATVFGGDTGGSELFAALRLRLAEVLATSPDADAATLGADTAPATEPPTTAVPPAISEVSVDGGDEPEPRTATPDIVGGESDVAPIDAPLPRTRNRMAAAATLLDRLELDEAATDRLRLLPLLARAWSDQGHDGGSEAEVVPLLAEILRLNASAAAPFAELADSNALERALAVNVYNDVRWFSAERFELTIEPLAELLDPNDPESVAESLREDAERAAYRFDRLIGRDAGRAHSGAQGVSEDPATHNLSAVDDDGAEVDDSAAPDEDGSGGER